MKEKHDLIQPVTRYYFYEEAFISWTLSRLAQVEKCQCGSWATLGIFLKKVCYWLWAIIDHFGNVNLYNKGGAQQQKFMEDML
jgi:hypothetical protein